MAIIYLERGVPTESFVEIDVDVLTHIVCDWDGLSVP